MSSTPNTNNLGPEKNGSIKYAKLSLFTHYLKMYIPRKSVYCFHVLHLVNKYHITHSVEMALILYKDSSKVTGIQFPKSFLSIPFISLNLCNFMLITASSTCLFDATQPFQMHLCILDGQMNKMDWFCCNTEYIDMIPTFITETSGDYAQRTRISLIFWAHTMRTFFSTWNNNLFTLLLQICQKKIIIGQI
jgi:hypothetical protein